MRGSHSLPGSPESVRDSHFLQEGPFQCGVHTSRRKAPFSEDTSYRKALCRVKGSHSLPGGPSRVSTRSEVHTSCRKASFRVSRYTLPAGRPLTNHLLGFPRGYQHLMQTVWSATQQLTRPGPSHMICGRTMVVLIPHSWLGPLSTKVV